MQTSFSRFFFLPVQIDCIVSNLCVLHCICLCQISVFFKIPNSELFFSIFKNFIRSYNCNSINSIWSIYCNFLNCDTYTKIWNILLCKKTCIFFKYHWDIWHAIKSNHKWTCVILIFQKNCKNIISKKTTGCFSFIDKDIISLNENNNGVKYKEF